MAKSEKKKKEEGKQEGGKERKVVGRARKQIWKEEKERERGSKREGERGETEVTGEIMSVRVTCLKSCQHDSIVI